jgi:hypothetical protein
MPAIRRGEWGQNGVNENILRNFPNFAPNEENKNELPYNAR